MSIKQSGAVSHGSEPEDVLVYIGHVTAQGYPAAKLALSRCDNGHDELHLSVDAEHGCAQWRCPACATSRHVADSADVWDDASPQLIACPECSEAKHNVGVGFSLRDDGEVKWVTVGHRCTNCGLLGSSADWKVDYSPSVHIMDSV